MLICLILANEFGVDSGRAMMFTNKTSGSRTMPSGTPDESEEAHSREKQEQSISQ